MYQFAIIGCGGLGMRYIQSLAKLNIEAVVYAVDVSGEALEKAKALFEGNAPSEQVKLVLCNKIDEIPVEIDIAAVVTTSGVRRTLVEELLAHSTVSYLILEKVLFPCLEDYSAIEALLKEKKIKTWINCSRRIIPFFSWLKEEFQDQKIRFELTGGAWGIGCNSIHYIDLINFITGNTEGLEVCTEKLDAVIIESKRNGYIEFTGTLEGRTDVCEFFSLHSEVGEIEPVLYTISSKEKKCVVNEGGGVAYMFRKKDKWALETIPLKAYYQSTMTSGLFEEIINTGSCMLPDYETAQKEHIPFITALLEFMNKDREEKVKRCPIT